MAGKRNGVVASGMVLAVGTKGGETVNISVSRGEMTSAAAAAAERRVRLMCVKQR